MKFLRITTSHLSPLTSHMTTAGDNLFRILDRVEIFLDRSDVNCSMQTQSKEKFQTCLCFIETVSLDGIVCKQLLLEKYHFVNFQFVEMFPSQDLFGEIHRCNLQLVDFDQIMLVNVRPTLGDVLKLDQLDIPVRIYTSGSKLQTIGALKNIYLWNHVNTPAANAILFDKSVGCGSAGSACVARLDSEDLPGNDGECSSVPRGLHGPLRCESYNALSCNLSAVMTILSSQCETNKLNFCVFPSFLCCGEDRDRLFSRENFMTTMRVEGVSAFYTQFGINTLLCNRIYKAQDSILAKVRAGRHFRVFNGHEIYTVDDFNIQPHWAFIPAQLSNRNEKIGALILRGIVDSGSAVAGAGDSVSTGERKENHGHGICVIFHNETTLDGAVICDRRCLGVSGMLGLEGNSRFTFAWFANDEDLEKRFPKIQPR